MLRLLSWPHRLSDFQFLPWCLRYSDRLEEKAARAASGVADAHALRGPDALDDQTDHLSGRAELPALLARVIGELLDKVFVCVAQHVGRDVGIAQAVSFEVLLQQFQDCVGETFLVVEIDILEDTLEPRVEGVRISVETRGSPQVVVYATRA